MIRDDFTQQRSERVEQAAIVDNLLPSLQDLQDFNKRTAPQINLSDKLNLQSDQALLCGLFGNEVRRAGKPVPIELPAAGKTDKHEGNNWSDPEGTKWKMEVKQDSAIITDANKRTIDIKHDKGQITSAQITGKDGGKLGAIETAPDGKKSYVYTNKDNKEIREPLKHATLCSDGVHMGLEGGGSIVLHVDGSMVKRNKDLQPTKVVDAAGNYYEYKWPNQNEFSRPDSVTIYGPSTKNQTHTYELSTPWRKYGYGLYVNEHDKPSTTAGGAGVSVGEGVQGGVGVAMPFQDKVSINVDNGGALQIRSQANTINGGGDVIENHKLDGTLETVRYDKWGQEHRSYYRRDGSPTSTQYLPK